MREVRRRRLLIAAAVLLAMCRTAGAQQPARIWQIGFLALRRIAPLGADFFGEFPRALRELGYVEGRQVQIHWRSAEGEMERLAALAAELVARKVDIIVAAGAQAVRAAQRATTTIPIVIGTAGDPVGSGFVKSLARPGGNITGLSDISSDLSPKLLDLLRSVVPKLSHVAALMNPDNSSHTNLLKSVQAAARNAGVRVTAVMARSPHEIDAAFATFARQKAEAAIATADALFNQQVRQIAELAQSHRLPVISGFWQYVDANGLLSYGQNFAHNFRRAAVYVDKILKGANPGDLPIEQPIKFELAVNLKAAKALGLKVPQELLLRADRVIE